jgi:hypothetical protein
MMLGERSVSSGDSRLLLAYFGLCAAVSFNLFSRLPIMYTLLAPLSARALAIICPMPLLRVRESTQVDQEFQRTRTTTCNYSNNSLHTEEAGCFD